MAKNTLPTVGLRLAFSPPRFDPLQRLASGSRRRLPRRAVLAGIAAFVTLAVFASRLWGMPLRPPSTQVPAEGPSRSLPQDTAEDFLSPAASEKPGAGGDGSGKAFSFLPSFLAKFFQKGKKLGGGEWKRFQEEARRKAAAFCGSDRYKEMQEGRAGYRLVTTSTHVSPMSMYVLGEKDYVSDSIAQSGAWDLRKGQEMERLMAEVRKVRGRNDLAFMDVGANVGWFTIYFASRNTSVIGFEAMAGNQDAVMGTLCQNPKEAPLVELHQLALGDKRQTCVLYSHQINKGNGQIKCMAPELRASWKLPEDMEGKGDVEMYRLDEVLGGRGDLDIGVLKMDVEGYEGWVIEGGKGILGRLKIPYVVTEFTSEGLGYRGLDPPRLLELWEELGYDVRKQCHDPGTAIQVDMKAKEACGVDAACLAQVPHIKFAALDEAKLTDVCCVLRSYSQEREKVLTK